MKDHRQISNLLHIWLPGVVLFAFFLVAHLSMNTVPGDYVELNEALNQYGFFDYLYRRYIHWTSRIILEALVVPLTPLAWAFADSLMFVLVWHSLVHIVSSRCSVRLRWVLCALVLCYPLVEVSGAGWIASCGMYVWPLALGLYALSIVARVLRDDKVTPLQCVIASGATLIAANQEQMAAILGCTLLVLFVWEAAHKRVHPMFVILFVFVCVDIALVLACPGNALRLESEIKDWMPSFASSSVLYKLYLGAADTLDRYLYEGIVPTLVMLAALALLVFSRAPETSRLQTIEMRAGHAAIADWATKIIVCIPIALIIIGTWLGGALDENLHYLVERFFTRPDLAAGARSLGSLATELVLIVCVAVSVCRAFGWNRRGWLMLAILAAGFASRVVMGFSPTLFASGDRTFIFMDFSMIIVAGFAFAELEKRAKEIFNKAFAVLCVIAMGCALDSLSAAALCDFIER